MASVKKYTCIFCDKYRDKYNDNYEADNIEEVALLFAMEIATETAKRHPLFLLFEPCCFVHQRVEARNRDLIDDFAAANQRDTIE